MRRNELGMLYNKKRKIAIFGLLVLSLAVHFAWFGHPNDTVFDEVHFGKFISAYFTHEYYFDIHPPLGKLILAGWGKLWGFRPGFSFDKIGDAFPDRTYMALRFLPSLAGSLLPLVLYGVARQLKLSHRAALTAGILTALDNALLVQSRFILLDSFLLLFGFGAIWSYLHWRNGGTRWLLACAGILGGMAMSIKWTGMTFLALIVILEALHLWKDRFGTARRRLLPLFITLVLVPFTVYYLTFIVHFALLTKSGQGDAFMSPEFRAGTLNSFEKFTELNIQMYESNKRLTATHPYSSKWYTWPLMTRPIFYWVKDHARIYLLGNPMVWWGSTVALLVALMHLVAVRLRPKDPTLLILAGAWFMNMLPFIGISRVMFLYHYFTGLLWAILLFAYVVDHPELLGLKAKNVRRVLIGMCVLTLGLFVFFAPLSYGLPMSDSAYHNRIWLPSWE